MPKILGKLWDYWGWGIKNNLSCEPTKEEAGVEEGHCQFYILLDVQLFKQKENMSKRWAVMHLS